MGPKVFRSVGQVGPRVFRSVGWVGLGVFYTPVFDVLQLYLQYLRKENLEFQMSYII